MRVRHDVCVTEYSDGRVEKWIDILNIILFLMNAMML